MNKVEIDVPSFILQLVILQVLGAMIYQITKSNLCVFEFYLICYLSCQLVRDVIWERENSYN